MYEKVRGYLWRRGGSIMGVKCRACVAIVLIILLLGSLWLYGSLEHQWDTCLKIYTSNKKFPSLNKTNISEEGEAPLILCPGQRFQVAELLAHLQTAPVSANDVLLKPYLASWDELIKFMEALGPMVGLISQEIESKTSIIRDLARKAEAEAEKRKILTMGRDSDLAVSHNRPSNSSKTDLKVSGDTFGYTSIQSMIKWELENNLVNFQTFTNSGCRNLLRLHRALLWLQSFLLELSKGGDEGEPLRKPSELCKETYQRTLSKHHTWWVRRAAELAFIAMPERPYFFKLVCVDTQAEATVVLDRVVRAIGEVYDRTEVALKEHNMLDLP
nr:glycolipid transfer protein domain-containing protein 2 [Misgurnus anguillicaudatus]XP_055055797.1 glycolipid transfer protein domain-containing protein 2 [Misgurnus anguillicaudatus]